MTEISVAEDTENATIEYGKKDGRWNYQRATGNCSGNGFQTGRSVIWTISSVSMPNFWPRLQPSERFWTLNKRIQEDRRRPGVQIELRKQSAVFELARLIADGAVSLDELDGFSEELQNMVRILCKRIELEEQRDQ